MTSAERQARWGHAGGTIELSGSHALIDQVERSLFSIGAVTVRLDSEGGEFLLHPNLLQSVLDLHAHAGVLSLLVRTNEDGSFKARAGSQQTSIDSTEPRAVIAAVHRLLREAGILIPPERANI